MPKDDLLYPLFLAVLLHGYALVQRVMPAMLQRALPKLGPPRRPKLLAQQARSRTRHIPSARQKLQAQGVVQRKALTLEKWHAAVQRQVRHSTFCGREQRRCKQAVIAGQRRSLQAARAGKGQPRAVHCMLLMRLTGGDHVRAGLHVNPLAPCLELLKTQKTLFKMWFCTLLLLRLVSIMLSLEHQLCCMCQSCHALEQTMHLRGGMQVGALVVQQQQQSAGVSAAGSQAQQQISCSRASTVLPLSAAGDRLLLLQPQPMLEVAAVEPQQHTS